MGKMKSAKRTKVFLRDFETIGREINNIIEIIVRGAWGTQSWKTFETICSKDPVGTPPKGSISV